MYQREESHELEGDEKTVAMKCYSHSTAFSECFIYFKQVNKCGIWGRHA